MSAVTVPRTFLAAVSVSLGRQALRVKLRRIAEIEEYHQCEALQSKVWGTDDIVGVPALDLITAQENGGIVIGAFVNEGELVGFVYSFLGLTPTGRLKQCSVINAVDPSYQNSGLGYHLKLAQRHVTLALGMDLITWTFDPLASRNAHLNLNKLGGISSRYIVNTYGTVQRGLNAGLETDRLLVEWWIQEPRVEQRLRTGSFGLRVDGALVNEVAVHARFGLPMNQYCDLERQDDVLFVEVPADIQAVKAADIALARAWRCDTRRIFLHYLSRGYKVTGFTRLDRRVVPQYCYVLQREGST